MSFFRIFQFWHLITRKGKQISKFREILGRSARQDLSAVRFLWRSVKRCRSYCPFNVVFSYFSTLAFNISESIIARELIPTGTCCILCGEHDGTIEIIYRATIFFSKWLPFAKMSTLSDFNENWYLGVIWRGEHDGTIDILFRATIFFSKWPPYCKIFNFVRFQWKLISWGILMWRTWWYHSSLVPSHNFFFKMAAISQKFQLCSISMKIDILRYIDVTTMMVLWIFFPKLSSYCINVIFVQF